MKAYPYNKKSEAEWIDTIPTHWTCLKIDSLFSQRKTKVSDKDYAPLSVTKKGIVPQLADAAKSNDSDNRKLVRSGDFVINSRSDRKGSCGVSNLDGSVSLINIVLEPRKDLNNQYIHYLLRSQPFSEEFYRYGRGIVADLWTTRYDEMKNILLPVPPRAEQDQIVRFLDWKVSEINQIISTKQKQMQVLKEFMRTEMERILNSCKAERTVRLKELGVFYKGGGFSRANLVEEKDYPAILYGDIYTQYEYRTETVNHFIDKNAYEASRKISKGDIVMAGTGETKDEIGKSILYTGDEIIAIGGDVIAFHPYDGVNTKYLLYQLYSREALKHRYINGKGDIIVHIYPTSLGDTVIPLPSKTEQKVVAEKIDRVISQAKRTIEILNEEISVLQEYKTKLISDVVTGQIDVRDIEIPEYEYMGETADMDSEEMTEFEESEDEEV